MTDRIGDGWIKQLDELRKLEGFVEDAGFRREFENAKQAIKQGQGPNWEALNESFDLTATPRVAMRAGLCVVNRK